MRLRRVSGLETAIKNEFKVIDEEKREELQKASNVYKVCHDYWRTQHRPSGSKHPIIPPIP